MSGDLWARVTADNDQDREECRRWWQEASEADKLLVWDMIQSKTGNPVLEVVLRFAQLAYAEMAVETQNGVQ